MAGQLEAGPEVDTFARKLDDCLSSGYGAKETRRRILRLVNDYCVYASDRANLHRISLNHRSNDDAEITIDVDGFRWEQEAQTWDLLRRLLPLRYPDTDADATTGRKSTYGGPVIWQDFLNAEPSAVERLAVLEWLQQNARACSDVDGGLGNQESTKSTRGWIHTQSKIKQRKRIIATEGPLNHNSNKLKHNHLTTSQTPMVTELDPDVITRQNRQLAPEDDSLDNATWLGCFEHLRRGIETKAVQDWCADRGEIWRAVSMSTLPGPPSNSNSNEVATLEPEMLVLWRRICFQLCRKGGRSDHERATYGILAGDVQSVETVCHSWDDFMFANYNALFRSQFDTFLVRSCLPPASANITYMFPIPDIGTQNGDNAAVETRLVHVLESHPKTSMEAIMPLKGLQAAIISHDLEQHLYEQGVVLSMDANSLECSNLIPKTGELSGDVRREKHVSLANHDTLRILAHVYFITSVLDRLSTPSLTRNSNRSTEAQWQQNRENSLVAYVSYLRLTELEELIPLYCSELREPRVYEVLHSNLLHLTDKSSRIRLLDLMRKSALNALTFVKIQPDLVFASLEPATSRFEFKIMEACATSLSYGRTVRTDFFGDDPDRVERTDDLLIRTLEWQMLVDEAWPGVFAVVTKIYKYFLSTGRLTAARSLSNRVSCADLMELRLRDGSESFDPLWQDSTDFWENQSYPASKPGESGLRIAADAKILRELECLVRALDGMETLASLVQMSKEDPTLRRDFWLKVADEIKVVMDNMKPLLKNWLQEQVDESDGAFQEIRDIYLPETVLAYISSLHFAGTSLSRDYLMEGMELAALFAEKDSDIAVCFSKCSRMVELVEAFASCSKALAVVKGETRSTPSSTKRLREMGWSRDLWSIGQR